MTLQEIDHQWEDILLKCLSDLKEKYPRLNEAQVADKVAIPRATFNRMKNTKSIPRLDNIIKLVLGSGNIEILTEAIALTDKELSSCLSSALEVSLKEKEKVLASEELEAILEDRNAFVIYLLASTSKGTSRDQIKAILGSIGLTALEKLLIKQVIVDREGGLSVKDKGILIRSFESIKYHISTYARHYKTEHVGKQRNYAHSLSEGLSLSGLKKVQEAHRRFHEEIQKIYRAEENRGEIPSFSVAFCDTFTAVEDDAKSQDGEAFQ